MVKAWNRSTRPVSRGVEAILRRWCRGCVYKSMLRDFLKTRQMLRVKSELGRSNLLHYCLPVHVLGAYRIRSRTSEFGRHSKSMFLCMMWPSFLFIQSSYFRYLESIVWVLLKATLLCSHFITHNETGYFSTHQCAFGVHAGVSPDAIRAIRDIPNNYSRVT